MNSKCHSNTVYANIFFILPLDSVKFDTKELIFKINVVQIKLFHHHSKCTKSHFSSVNGFLTIHFNLKRTDRWTE